MSVTSARLLSATSVRLAGFVGFLSLASLSCGSRDGDEAKDFGVPPPAGKGFTLKDITAPDSPSRAQNGQNVLVTGVTVIAVDTHDETINGKSDGTIYVQDLGSTEPYSGLSLFAPAFVPGNLRVSPGDVLDLDGMYQENKNIGATVTFAEGAPLPQLARPVSTFRFERPLPEPVDIDVNDLATYEKGRKWLNMLVRVKNVTVLRDLAETDRFPRVSAPMLPGDGGGACDAPFPKPPTLTNELTSLGSLGIKSGTTIKEVVGVVTYFCNLHLSPRSAADIKL